MPRRRTSDTDRLEAFSDGVFAIALTLLVLDLRPPAAGDFAAGLLAEWEGYVAYLVAFLTIGSIWLSHHDVFTRVARVDPLVLVANLGVLLGASLVPWPTTLMAAAVRGGRRGDETAAIIVFAVVTLLISLPWSGLSAYLVRHPELLESGEQQAWMRRTAHRNLGSIAVSVVGAGIGLVAPIVALFLYLVVPVLFMVATLRTDRGPASAAGSDSDSAAGALRP